MAQARDALAQNSFGRLHRKGAPVPKEAATPKSPASLYTLISGQVPWVALLSTLLCGVAMVGLRFARRDVTDRPGRPRPSRLTHAPQNQARETRHAAAQHAAQRAAQHAAQRTAQQAAARRAAEQHAAAEKEATQQAKAKKEAETKEAARIEAERKARTSAPPGLPPWVML